MQDAADWRKAMKLEGHVNSKVKRIIDELISNLARRDLLFFIDDTESMKEHSAQIEVSFQTLAYIAKSIDPDDLELSFVSKPRNIFKSRKTSPLIEELRQHLNKHMSVKGRIESSLSTLINEKIMRRLPLPIPLLGQVPPWSKPITIFVFTDGKWGEGVRPGNGLTEPISKVMREMKKRGLNRTHVMFQFLRFGDDEEGREHLVYLDNFGKDDKWDIVDTRDINGDVYSMFLAALTEHNDINNDQLHD
ncbi:putative serine threonine protein kinase [Diaporthe ampelina]|uniref:Putative serine threonine protein kinase n=1 Tax=Diaporthe ampelina TaxID=1214573 RepID=A0A0G2F6Y1_9PEZI|nr:putative serine threonine protein kinase [Diaporthe ampelina]